MVSDIREWVAGAGAGRFWRTLQSRGILGGGYAIAALLTGVAILLAASPPSQGPLGPTSELILTVLGFNLVLILALTLVVALRFGELLDQARGCSCDSSPCSRWPPWRRPWW
jgi:hypothetical protein